MRINTIKLNTLSSGLYLEGHTMYVRWQTGLLTASDWLWPVTRGGGGDGARLHQSLQRDWVTSTDALYISGVFRD